jgi:hypothetical protein
MTSMNAAPLCWNAALVSGSSCALSLEKLPPTTLATLDLAHCGEIGTGLIHIDDDANELPKILGATDWPLNELSERELCPRSKLLPAVNVSLR